MDPDAFRLLLGLLFADGNLSRTRCPRGYHYRATFMGGVGEKPLLEEKLFEVRKCLPVRAGIGHYMVKSRKADHDPAAIRKKGTLVYRFRVCSKHLEGHWKMLRPRGYPEVTSSLLECLGARAAAWLWSENVRILPEDTHDGVAVLRRVGDTGPEAEMVAEWLALLTGAKGYIDLRKRTPRLHFDRNNRELLQTALHPVAPFHTRWLFKP